MAQGLPGGITVIYLLPKPISISHAGLAQLFFALVVGLGVFTSPGWRARYGLEAVQPAQGLRRPTDA